MDSSGFGKERQEEQFRLACERYEAIGVGRELDPAFHAAWRREIFKSYPWLDRLLPAEDQ